MVRELRRLEWEVGIWGLTMGTAVWCADGEGAVEHSSEEDEAVA